MQVQLRMADIKQAVVESNQSAKFVDEVDSANADFR